jgi:hypothetical protein
MVYFQTKNPNLGKFWRVFSFGRFCGHWENFPYLVCCTKKDVATLFLIPNSVPDLAKPGANPTTFEFTATTPALQ